MNIPMNRILDATPLELGEGAAIELGLRQWRVSLDESQQMWVVMDQPDRSANTVSEVAIDELATILQAVRERQPRGVVLRSGKPDGFIVGADIEAFRGVNDAGQVRPLLERAHKVADELADLDCPTVAVIHGHCLGGGLELALACDRRIARSDASLGFPEVQLGLHPGLGGTARLPHLIRPDQALQMMLTGKPVSAKRARSLGLVDAVVEERHVAAAVRAAIDGDLASRGGGAAVRAMNLAPSRKLITRRARDEAAKQARPEHYPAPFRLLELWEDHGGDPRTMRERELQSFAELLCGSTAQNLIRVYFLREALRRPGKQQDAGVRHVHVVGAGTMGGDIAAWCAHQGLTATLEDQQAHLIGPAIKRANGLFSHKHPDARQRRAAADRLVPDPAGSGRARADLIIEAVPEKLELKQEIFAELERAARSDAVLASNTSGILLGDIGQGMERPERLVGLHFFNPVSRMQLVEVVRHDRVDPAVLDRATAFAVAIDRLPAVVASAPGFLVNRTLMPYLLEALLLMDEGASAEQVDAAAEAFGMPMGPAELADQVGLDIALDVADGLRDKLDTPMPEVPEWLRRKVEGGDLGVKSGKGLYDYDDEGHPEKKDLSEPADDEMVDRLILPMINTAVGCLDDGVVDDADVLDGALIFGTGFAPFRGGPLCYARHRGIASIRSRLEELAGRHGERFTPARGWQQIDS